MDKPWSAQTAIRKEWSAWRRSNFSFFQEHLRDLPSTHSLVDIGAGPVQFRDIFLRFKYTGVDFVKYPDVSVVTDLTEPLPLPSNSTNIVVLSNTLEHIPDPRVTLSECYRILAPGGLLIGTVPFLVQVHQAPYDFNRYTNYQLENLLRETGFSNPSVEPLGKLIDAYNTMEIKFFAHLPYRYIRFPFRIMRRVGTALLRLAFGHVPANDIFTEGYGFMAYK